MDNLFVGTTGSISLASHIALEDAGTPYQVTYLNIATSEHRGEAYAKINPKLRVPTLVTEQGNLTETPAILLYIAQTRPQANLAPIDPFGLATLQVFTNYLCSTAHPAHAHKMRGSRWSDDPAVIEALKLKVPQNMNECFALIDSDYFKGPWVLGEHYSVADPYLYILATWMEGDGVDTTRFPRIMDHRSRMTARPQVQKVLESY